jgi:hypothetical protein
MSTTLDYLVRLLPAPLQGSAKALVPALGTVIAVVAQYAATGAFDQAQLITAITGLSAAFVTHRTTNNAAGFSEEIDLPDDGGPGSLWAVPPADDFGPIEGVDEIAA